MKLEDFDFKLPKQLIAQKPVSPRDHARLLVYDRQARQIKDDFFYNLQQYLPANTTLVLNNSKVEKCRLQFGNTEVFVIDTVNPTTVRALVRPGKKFADGKKVQLIPDILEAEVTDIDAQGIRTLRLNLPIDSPQLNANRFTPLPPYITQDESLSKEYQTVYAYPLGSKAAPTAGLHFTATQLRQISQSFPVARLTLHVGLGTFAPVKTENIDRHELHHEWYELNQPAATKLNAAKHITAVGTTSARTLESVAKPFAAVAGSTNIFIKPGYEFKNVDALVTNFHLPKSSLLMLVAAFMGLDEMKRLYSHAVNSGYRFYSFGDAMLIL